MTTIPALLAERRSDEQAIVTEDRAITYAELDDASRTLAAGLLADGLAASDRVALLGPNGIDWAVQACALWRAGAVLVPLSTFLRPPELAAQLETADVVHVLSVRTFRGRDYADELRPRWVADDLPTGSAPVPDDVRPDDDLCVLFTSGSTGSPKGTIHTHAGALGAVASSLEARGIRAGERLYIPMPFFWTGGLAAGLLSTLVAGATLLTEAEPEPGRTLAFLERERVTLFRGWPEQAVKLTAHPSFASTDLSSLGDASLGAVLPPDRRPAPGARPNLFGMTETFGPWCGDHLDVDLPRDKWGSCGRPFAGIEVRTAEDGEIWLRGPNLMRAVCGREVLTSDGWYATGDRGRVDDDGYVWFEGRLDDMFKVKGATVYPSEVESALRSVDDVRQAHVTDVDGEVGALVVTDASLPELEVAVKERLSRFKVPSRWLVTDDVGAVPVTATGKVDKDALRATLRSVAQGENI